MHISLGDNKWTRNLKPDICKSQALVNNPKIDVRDGTYGFKPKYNLKDKKALLRLLDKHDQLGLGGVLLDDVEEGLPNSAKAIKVTRKCHLPHTVHYLN